MTIKEFVDAYNAKTFMNTKQGVEERLEWIKKELEVKEYVSFTTKRKIAEMVVEENTKEVDGIKKYNSIDGYIAFVVASIMAHTTLEFSSNPVEDYDLLAKSGLLPQIISQFQGSHDEIDLLRKMVLDMEMEDNNTNALIGYFLNKILGMLEVAKGKLGDFNVKNILGADIKEEDLTKLIGFLNKIK